MQMRCRRRATGQDEGAQRRQLGIQRVDLVFEPVDLGLGDAQRLVVELLAAIGRAKVGAQVEHVVLDAAEHGIDRLEAGPTCSRATPIDELASSTVP